ncbi:pldh-t, partial [Symbiodinium sp. KB8]
ELLEAVGVERSGANEAAVQSLMDHYIGEAQDSLLSRYGDKLLISVLPAARWVSSHLAFRIFPASGAAAVVQDIGVVEPAHPKGDDEANQRRYRADRWREAVEPAPPGSNGHAPFRPVLLSTFLGNWRHRHTELVALDTVVDAALKAVAEGKWRWTPDFWESLCGEIQRTPLDSSPWTLLNRWSWWFHTHHAYPASEPWRSCDDGRPSCSCVSPTRTGANGAECCESMWLRATPA